ncbi:MAG: AAA family ATPase [Exilibacterium sp.]
MKIRELNFTAFGPFTDRSLIFEQEPEGLHIVYGPNEAGKSSALRGLHALLFGIDERTADNFLHANDKLRIAGRVYRSNGEELSFARRKGRKNTLLSHNGEALDEGALSPFLQGVTPELFKMLFGIDHRALIQGGREILQQKGEVGQALFSASLGSHTLHAVLKQLDEQAEALFKPRGSTPVINTAVKEYTELHREIRETSLSSREWEQHCRAQEKTAAELEQVQTELTDHRAKVSHLQRIQRVLPKLARRQALLQQVEELGEVRILPAPFSKRRQVALTEREQARAIIQMATVRLDELREQLEALPLCGPALEQSASIEALHARLGAHRKAMQDRPHLEAEYRQLLIDAESRLKDLRPDLTLEEIECLRATFKNRQRVTELSRQIQAVEARVKQTSANLEEIQPRVREVEQERRQLPHTASLEGLREAVLAARKAGDMDTAIESRRRDLTLLERQCETDLARLGLWSGTLEALVELPVPHRVSIERLDTEYSELNAHRQRLCEQQDQMTEQLREISRQLETIHNTGTVPTERELAEARSEREQVWQLVRRQWVDGEDSGAGHKLADVYEALVSSADELADRLRREADRVHSHAALVASQRSVQQQAQEVAQLIEQCSADKERIDTEWEALWAPCRIQPRSPREMRAWSENLDKLHNRVEQLNPLRLDIDALEHIRETHTQRLARELEKLHHSKPNNHWPPLETALLCAEKTLADLEQTARQRQSLETEIDNLNRRLASAHNAHKNATSEFDELKRQWSDAIASLGLDSHALPAEALNVIENLRELFAKHSEAEKLRVRIQSMDSDAESFRRHVSEVAAKVAPELSEAAADEAATRLNLLLTENQSRHSRRQQIESQLQQAREDIQKAEATLKAMTERLRELCAEAGCADPTALERAELRCAEYLRLKAEIAAVEQEILDTGEGAALEELQQLAERVDPDHLPGQIEALTTKIDEELEPKRTALAEAKGRRKKELELMDGSDRAATLAERSQSVLAQIRTDAEHYTRLKLAARILRDEIERYRKQNQGPLVERASEHFTALTCTSFAGLRTDFNTADEPVLVGLRPGGERVGVEGMSSGTRDQLYLSLRLAALEKYMEASNPMPFIVDDILVDFDDKRSAAALDALVRLGQKTQVILFTHHSRVVEQARQQNNGHSVYIHNL